MNNETFAAKVLANIHHLVTWHFGQNYLFNGCMGYLMECLHENKEYDYWFFSGVTGDSFTQLYRMDGEKSVDSLSHDAFDEALAKRAFDACGYHFSYVGEKELKASKPKQIRRIMDHINEGLPVITQGFDGTGAFSIICGYENEGKTLLALKGDNASEEKSQNGLDHSKGLLFVGSKKQLPGLTEVYRNAVMRIPQLMAAPPCSGLLFGKQAFEAWADGLLSDPMFEGIPDAEMEALRWRRHCALLCIAGTNGCARGFLEKARLLCPDMIIIPRLQPIYEKMQSIFEEISAMQGGFWIPFDTLRNADSRRMIVNKIREFSKCCDEILDAFAKKNISSCFVSFVDRFGF